MPGSGATTKHRIIILKRGLAPQRWYDAHTGLELTTSGVARTLIKKQDRLGTLGAVLPGDHL